MTVRCLPLDRGVALRSDISRRPPRSKRRRGGARTSHWLWTRHRLGFALLNNRWCRFIRSGPRGVMVQEAWAECRFDRNVHPLSSRLYSLTCRGRVPRCHKAPGPGLSWPGALAWLKARLLVDRLATRRRLARDRAPRQPLVPGRRAIRGRHRGRSPCSHPPRSHHW